MNIYEEILKLIKSNMPVIIALSGVVIGAIINNIFNWNIKKRETQLKLIEKLIDKKIQAYEAVLMIAKTLRVVITTLKTDDNSNLITYPNVLENKNKYSELISSFSSIVNSHSHWLDTKTIRELYFVQDYLSTLYQNVENINDENIKTLGILIKQDFIDLLSSLEKIILESYQNKITNLDIKKINGWHKYKKEETINRLNEFLIMKKKFEITSICNRENSANHE